MIEITSAIILLVSSLYSSANMAIAQDIVNSANTQSNTAIEEPATLESYIRDYFEETPVLADIAKCESRFRQVNSNGDLLRGKVNKSDVGIMQINEFYHGETALRLKLDLTTIEGNLDYAKYLFEKEGTTPWNASKKCWSK